MNDNGRQKRVLRIKSLGPTIGPSGKPPRIRDGDGDGKCKEENGKWVPCPPGVARGSVLRNVGGIPTFDLPKGGGIDPIEDIPQRYIDAMATRMRVLGLTEDELRAEVRAAMQGATPELIAEARQWYPRVNARARKFTAELNSKYGTNYSFEQVAGVIATLSPAREFGKNINDAVKMMQIFAADEEFTITKAAVASYRGDKDILDKVIARAKNDTLKPSDFSEDEALALIALHPVLSRLAGRTGYEGLLRAVYIAGGFQDVDKAIGGPKARSFYSNIVDPDAKRVTIDTWMYRIMVPADKKLTRAGESLTLAEHEARGRKLQDFFQGTPGAIKGTGINSNVGLYPVFGEVIRELSAEYGLSPSALQAVLWEVARVRSGYKPTSWDRIERNFKLPDDPPNSGGDVDVEVPALRVDPKPRSRRTKFSAAIEKAIADDDVLFSMKTMADFERELQERKDHLLQLYRRKEFTNVEFSAPGLFGSVNTLSVTSEQEARDIVEFFGLDEELLKQPYWSTLSEAANRAKNGYTKLILKNRDSIDKSIPVVKLLDEAYEFYMTADLKSTKTIDLPVTFYADDAKRSEIKSVNLKLGRGPHDLEFRSRSAASTNFENNAEVERSVRRIGKMVSEEVRSRIDKFLADFETEIEPGIRKRAEEVQAKMLAILDGAGADTAVGEEKIKATYVSLYPLNPKILSVQVGYEGSSGGGKTWLSGVRVDKALGTKLVNELTKAGFTTSGRIDQMVADEKSRLLSLLVKETLEEVRPMGGTILGTPKERATGFGSFSSNDLINEAASWFPSDWIELSNARSPIEFTKNTSRAEYDDRPGGYGIISTITLNNTRHAARHELGHRMEQVVPGLRALEEAFYLAKTGGEDAQPLQELDPKGKYGANERARPDKFFHPYVGKAYIDSYFEIFTMGIQELGGSRSTTSNKGDLGMFSTKIWSDADHLAFIFGVLTVLGRRS